MRANYKVELASGIFILLGIAALIWLATKATNYGQEIGEDAYFISARFTNVADLTRSPPMQQRTVNRGLGLLCLLLAGVVVAETAYLVPLRWENGRLRAQLAAGERRAEADAAKPITWGGLTEGQRGAMLTELQTASGPERAV